MSATDNLQGCAAFVTGASSGLGARFAEVLARAGAKVALAARRADRLAALADRIAAFDGRAIPVVCDVTEPKSIRAAVETAETELGPIGILVNNSGITVTKRILDVTPAEFDGVMATNVRGAFFTAQAVAEHMIRHETPGRIVNIASVLGLKPLAQVSVYAMSKAAMIQMTKAMALEWGRHGINVNCLCPGYIETEMNAAYWQTEGGRKLMALQPRRRIGTPADLDAALLLLASGQPSRLINGAVLAVDDGLSVS
ncbi:MAG TPA: SDR family NAD(P)-dependent oxidoreductase [Candidatus Cybelea sp.]|nr:SDR family NAD(P)-dependent oxidoreductase [Candidatus Cybelea sp.]